MLKAQFEFAAIAGIVLVLAIVIALTYQAVTAPLPTPVPPAIAAEQALLKDSVETLAEDGGREVISIAERQGGYMTPQVLGENFNVRPFAFFMNNGVAYWQKCGTSYYPSAEELEETLERGMYEYLLRTLKENGTVGGKEVVMGLKAMTVDARVLDHRVDFTIDLPTRLANYTIRDKYTASIPTDFGRIYRFASALSDELAESRALDVFTISALWMSKGLPTMGMMNDCGEAIVMSPDEVSEELEGIARHVVTSLEMWEPMEATEGIKYYSIEEVKGQKFQDIDPDFWLADDFEVTTYDPIVIVNSEINLQSPMAVVPYCIKPYANYYSLTYPVIVSVRDSLLDSDFNFAVLVNVDGMEPGDCVLPGGREECGEPECTAKVRAVDGWGSPVKGALFSFGGCQYARTDSFGEAAADIGCGPQNITVTKGGGFFPLSEEVPEEGINGTYTLHRMPDIEINIYTLNRTERGGFDYCDVQRVENESVIIMMQSKAFNATADNRESGLDIGECLKEAGRGDACGIGDQAADETECLSSLDECLEGGLTDRATVSYAPGGYEYSFRTMVTNPYISAGYPVEGDSVEVTVDVSLLESKTHTRYLTEEDYLFLQVPLFSHEDTILIPEADSSINLYVPETSHLLERAAEIYRDRYRHYLQGGSEPWHVIKTETCSALDEDCARGMALQYVLAWLRDYDFRAELEACSLRMVEYAA